jgi:alpha-galactosidase
MLAFVAASLSYNNGAPHSRLPPLGWSSWVALGPGADHPIFDFCDESGVKAAIDAFHDVQLYQAGFRHFHLDDCWAGGRNASGYLYAEKDNFPNGMKPVVDYAHSKGLSFGLCTSASLNLTHPLGYRLPSPRVCHSLLADPAADGSKHVPADTCAGTQTCVGGRPGSKGHWHEDAAVFAEWGVDWVKMDWYAIARSVAPTLLALSAFLIHYRSATSEAALSLSLSLSHRDPACSRERASRRCNTDGMVPQEAYGNMSAAMNATGRHMHLNMCEWGVDSPWEWGGKISQSWRMSGDHTGIWSSTKDKVRASAAIP